jgi:HlyD family secretion protein
MSAMTATPLEPAIPLPDAPPAAVRRPREAAPPGPGRWRSLLVWIVAVLLAVAAAAWLWRGFAMPLTVQLAPVGTGVAEQVYGLGTVGADVQSSVGFKVAGVINEINANEGDHVKAGAVLARLDARDIAAQVEQARASLLQARAAVGKAEVDVTSAEASSANARAVAARRQALVKQGFASVEETQANITAMQVATANLEVARTGVKIAEAGVAAAQAQLDYANATLANYTLRAPYDAWVVARTLNLGAMPVPGQGVFTLADPRTIWVVAYVDERLAGRLKAGQPAEIELRSEPGRRFPGHVARIEIRSDAVNEERVVDIAFDHLPPDIHLDEQAYATITTGLLPRAVLVPETAVTGLAENRGTVWTLEQGRLARRHVTFGPQLLDGRLPVLGGLPDGAAVVLPQAGLAAGRAARAKTGAETGAGE